MAAQGQTGAFRSVHRVVYTCTQRCTSYFYCTVLCMYFLGVDTELDKSKLVQSKKPGERKAVKKAYEEAILHR